MSESKTQKTTAESAENSELKKILAASEYTKIPKVGDIIKGKIIDISSSELRLDIDGLTTGIIRGREFYDESDENADLKIGDEVEATVVEFENENGEMELSLRFAGHQRAWDHLNVLKTSGEIITVTISDANKGGLMAKVGQISGFMPVSQLSPENYPRVPGGDKGKILERLRSCVGKKLKVKVLDADEASNKLIISEKAAWEEEQKDVISRFKVGDVVEGKITAITDFGVFVEFGPHLEGLIHISELAWQRIDNPENIVKVGQTIKAEIIEISGSKIFLSSKKLKKDPWENIDKKYQSGQLVKGKVLKVNPFGLFVELDSDIHGLAHISELSDKPVTDVNQIAKVGDELEFTILSIEPKNHRLGLSLKKRSEKREKNQPKADPMPEAGTAPRAEKADAKTAEPAKEKKVKKEKTSPANPAEKNNKDKSEI